MLKYIQNKDVFMRYHKVDRAGALVHPEQGRVHAIQQGRSGSAQVRPEQRRVHVIPQGRLGLFSSTSRTKTCSCETTR